MDRDNRGANQNDIKPFRSLTGFFYQKEQTQFQQSTRPSQRQTTGR